MPWRIGIDEAGYGPNLGPFVMTAVACRVPESLLSVSLWHRLRKLVRKCGGKADGRLIIDDSKKVYSQGKGLAGLERAALFALDAPAADLREALPLFAPDSWADLKDECWFHGGTRLPIDADALDQQRLREAWREVSQAHGIRWLRPRADIVCTPRVNALIDRYDSKGAVLGLSFVRLVRAILAETGDEALHLTVDKHGGRSQYSALLQEAFAEGWVVSRSESARESRYEVLGLGRPIHVVFRVEGDGSEMTVALASMVSKYLREALMGEWNAFWQKEVPGLKATAGYPSDARRFYDEIAPALRRLNVREECVWRKR